MTFTIKQSELNKALALVGKAVSQNKIVPASSCVRLQTIGDKIEVSACNLQVSMQTTIPGSLDAFDFMIIADKFIKLISSLPDQPLMFTLNTGLLTIKSKSGQYELPFEPAGDFPVINIETDSEALIQSEDLFSAIYSTAYARLTDEVNLKFTGLQVEFEKNRATFIGCNLLLLSSYVISGKFKPGSILLPIHVTNTLAALNFQCRCVVKYSIKSVGFEFENGLIIKSLLIDEKYPDWRSIIPKNEIMCTLPRTELSSAIKRVVEFSPLKAKVLSIIGTGGELYITAADADLKQSGKETLKADLSGDIKININGDQAIAALSHLGTENITIYYGSPSVALVIKDGENLVMIMPIQD